MRYREPWLDHDARYRRSAKFLQGLKGRWTDVELIFYGDFYRIHGAPLEPKPLQKPIQDIFPGGSFPAARQMAATGTS